MTTPQPCHKESFPSEATARQIARTYQRNYGDRSRVYCCDLCGWWHLTGTRGKGGEAEYTLRLRMQWAAKREAIDAI
jgi:hypothetical protein